MLKYFSIDIRACLLLALGCLISTVSAARGRVKIQNGLILTDRSTLLRGASTTEPLSKADLRKWKESYGLNCFRVLIMDNDGKGTFYMGDRSGASSLAALDALIDNAAAEGFYIILDNHGGYPGSQDGKVDAAQVKGFWQALAPRYKDRTHVIYELKNEPVAWSAPYSDKVIGIQKDGFKLIRSLAPQTHVILWSYANMSSAGPVLQDAKKAPEIDYRNASIGFHWYSGSRSAIEGVKKEGYPLICTEMRDHDNNGENQSTADKDMLTRLTALEATQTGWTLFRFPEGRKTRTLATMKQPITQAGLKWVPDFGNWPLPAGATTGIAYYTDADYFRVKPGGQNPSRLSYARGAMHLEARGGMRYDIRGAVGTISTR